MARASFTFEGLDAMERRLRRAGPDASHVMVWDRTERDREENLGRFNLTATDALPYLEPGGPAGGDAPDEPSDDEDLDYDLADAFDDEEDEPEPACVSAREPITAEQIADAACRWLRDLAERNTLGEPFRRFRVRIYGPKGLKTVDSGTFICRNEDYDLDVPAPVQASLLTQDVRRPDVREIPPPSYDAIEQAASARGMKALGDYYAQWGRIVLGSVHQLQGVNNAMVVKLHRQLDASRDQVDELVGAILNLRAAELELDEKRRSAEKTDDTRAEIAKHALQQLGEAAKAFLAAKGVTPEMAEVFGTLGQSPELMSVLGDPDVRVLMQDPTNLKFLASMLKQAAAQARVAREAGPQSDQAA